MNGNKGLKQLLLTGKVTMKWQAYGVQGREPTHCKHYLTEFRDLAREEGGNERHIERRINRDLLDVRR